MNFVTESQNYTNITATTTVSTEPCAMLGIFVATASSSPSIAVTDGARTVVGSFVPSSSTFYAMPARTSTDLVVTLSGTINCTVFWT